MTTFDLLYLLLGMPYLLLLKKGINLSVKLIFVSLFELALLCTLSMVSTTIDNGSFVSHIYVFNIFASLIIIINILIISALWIMKKLKINNSINH